MSFLDRIKNAWNVFNNRDPTADYNLGPSYSYRMGQATFTRGNERSIVTSVYNRIAMDVAAVKIQHVRVNDDGHFVEQIESGLNECLSVEANVDQTGRGFIQDVVISMLDEGCVAIVPTDVVISSKTGASYDIRSLRTGKVVKLQVESRIM